MFSWQWLAAFAATMSTMVGAPLAALVFYLRSIREEQRATFASLQQRIDQFEEEMARLRVAVETIQRAYTTKEEWLRETMLARGQLERMSAQLARLQADMENTRSLATQFGKATNAIIQLVDHLAGRLAV